MEGTIVAAIVTAMAAVIGLFFGKQYWTMFSGLINSQKLELERLQELVRSLRDRVDEVEKKYYEKALEMQELHSELDSVAATSQFYRSRGDRLRGENEALIKDNEALAQENVTLRADLEKRSENVQGGAKLGLSP